MKRHTDCPMCETEGVKVPAQDEMSYVCMNDGCRVLTFAAYYG